MNTLPQTAGTVHDAQSSWSVAATIRAPAHQVDAFVAHYVRLGAERVFVFFDDPDWTAHDSEAGQGRLRTFVCCDGYWRNLPDLPPYVGHAPGRPVNIETRQSMNMLFARAVMPSAWLLHVDVDELLWCSRPTSEVLRHMPPQAFSVLARPLEAVYPKVATLGEEFSTGIFKRFTQDQAVVEDFYPAEIVPFLDGGLLGHAIGKTFVRKLPTISRMSVHHPVPADPRFHANVESPDLELLHFEGQSFELFKEKSLLREKSDFARFLTKRALIRAEYVSAQLRQHGAEGLMEAYKRLYVMTEEQISRGVRCGFLVRREESVVAPAFEPARANERLAFQTSARPSQWQGLVLRTIKGQYLAVRRNGELRAEKPGALTRDNSSSLIIEVLRMDSGLTLSVNCGGVAEYLMLLGGRLSLSKNPDDAAVFTETAAGMEAGSWVALRIGDKALSFDKEGAICIDRPRTTWRQCFQVKRVLPQL